LPFGGNPPQQYPEYQQLGDESVMRINGQDVRATLDGVGIPFAFALHLLQNGSALPAALDRYQHLQGFSFDNRGGGTFRSTWSTTSTSPGWVEKSDNNGNVTGRSWEPDGTVHTNTFEVNWSFGAALRQTKEDKLLRKLNKNEVSTIGDQLKQLLSQEKCLRFVEDLLDKASKSIEGLDMGYYPDALVTDDIMGIFNAVRDGAGFSFQSKGYSTIVGDYGKYANGQFPKVLNENAGVLIGGTTFYFPSNKNDMQYEWKDVAPAHIKNFLDVHFNFNDITLANALGGNFVNVWDKKFAALSDADQTYEIVKASNFWSDKLKANCSITSPVKNKKAKK
jgi:hypothetical protein